MTLTLREYLDRNEITQEGFAEKIGVSGPYISLLCKARYWPGADVMMRIWHETNGQVTPNDFLKERMD